MQNATKMEKVKNMGDIKRQCDSDNRK